MEPSGRVLWAGGKQRVAQTDGTIWGIILEKSATLMGKNFKSTSGGLQKIRPSNPMSSRNPDQIRACELRGTRICIELEFD